MFEVLPLKYIREEDYPLVGGDLIKLSKLCALDFPIVDGLVVFPPEFKLRTILEHYQYKDREVFEQNLTIIKKEVHKIEVPKELSEKFKNLKIDTQSVWRSLLEVWLQHLRERIWKDGFYKGLTLNLTPQFLALTTKIYASGTVSYNDFIEDYEVEIDSGSLSDSQIQEAKDLAKKADTKLFIPNTYSWITEGLRSKVKLVRIREYIEPKIATDLSQDLDKPKSQDTNLQKSTLKMFLNLKSSEPIESALDGVLISGEDSKDFDHLVLNLVEASRSLADKSVIFKFSDKKESFGGVRGALRLIHQHTLFKSEAGAFNFCRNKQNLTNLHLCIPFVRSSVEFISIKKELLAYGISRKPSLKLWLEICVPENLLNLQEYLDIGFDGVILNIDELAGWTCGFDPLAPESVFYKSQVEALLKLLQQPLRQLHQAKIPVLASGLSAYGNDSCLEYLIEKGVFGIIVGSDVTHSFHSHVRFLEKRLIRKKS